MADDISRLLEQTCCAFIPEYYDGVLEALRIQQINDAEIEPFVSSIMRLFRNSYIKTADIDYVEELEDGLGIGHEGTFEQRRDAIINELNNVFIANDENIITLAMSIFGGDNLEMITDCKRLITIITTALNNEDSMYAVESLKYVYMALAPLLPQNIDFRVGVHSSNVINVKYEYGWTTHLHTALGSIEYVEPEPQPEDIEIWYLRNNDERDYTVARTNAAPSIYKDGSNKTEFGKTYEVLELRRVNGDLVDAEQDGVEKPVNAVCPAVLSGDVANNQATMYYRWYGNSSQILVYTVKVRVLNYLTLYTARYDNAVRNYGDVTVANGTTLGIRQRGENDSGRIPDMYKTGYLYNIIGVFKDNGTEIDKTGLSVINSGGYFYVKNESGSDVSFNHLRLKFEIDPDPTYTAYSRSASYQNSNQTLQTAVYTSIYEPGSNNVVAGDTHKDYEIIGMWNAAGTALQFEQVGLSCYLYNGNPRIRIMNKRSSSISWNHIEYKAHDVFRFYNRDDRADYALHGSKAAYNRNGIQTIERTANETYTIVGVYMADGTQIPTPADLEVSYASSLRQIRISTQYEHTFAYVDVVVSGGDAPTTASALSLNNEEEM